MMNEDLTESFDFDELEEKLQSQLEEELADMQFLAEEKEKIGNPDNLGNVIMVVVWGAVHKTRLRLLRAKISLKKIEGFISI